MLVALGFAIILAHAALWFGVLEDRYWRHRRAIPMLGRPDMGVMRGGPRVAVLVPARNEAAAI